MDYNNLLDSFKQDFESLEPFDFSKLTLQDVNPAILKLLFNCIDLTTLNTTDNSNSVNLFCKKVVDFAGAYPNMPPVAAVCVFPVFASVISTRLKGLDIGRAVVSAGFPTSQTFLSTKLEETRRALFFGANEIDIVISVGEFLDGNYEFVVNEISSIRDIMGDAHLKVIIETGALQTPENIWNASILAMEAGADFIKTSTGKLQPAATPEAAWVMTHAIKAFEKMRGKMIGFKPAGGIVTVDDAITYFSMQKQVLGEKWINNKMFRLGASRLANNILTELEKNNGTGAVVSYF